MKHPNANFIKNFIIKPTKEQIEERKKAEMEAFKKLHEENKNKKLSLTEATKEALEQVISATTTNKAPQSKLKVYSQLNEQVQTSEIQVQSPLVIKDNKIQLDFNSLTDFLSKENASVVQKTLDLMKVKTLDGGGGGGGAVGIVAQDSEGNDVRLLRSVSNLIFKGPGVDVQRKGKDVEVYISSSIDTSADFPREASVLEIYSAIQDINNNIAELNGQNIPDALATVTYVAGTTWGYL